jgi:hypothetical protein
MLNGSTKITEYTARKTRKAHAHCAEAVTTKEGAALSQADSGEQHFGRGLAAKH